MQLFYTPDIQDKLAFFPEEEPRHCTQVLRHREGDLVHLTDGRGGMWQAQLVSVTKKSCQAVLQEEISCTKRPYDLHIGIGPTKQIDRMEWFLEKATEIGGLASVTPLICQRSERQQVRLDRLEKILLSAMKQSLQAWLPTLAPLTPFSRYLKNLPMDCQRRIAHCAEGEKTFLTHNLLPRQNVCLLIGPEGDFSESEIEEALQADFTPVSLGDTRLRTETAAVFACSLLAGIQYQQ